MRDRSSDARDPPSEAVERFAQLPRATREWLETRRSGDWDEINDALGFYRSARTNGKFLLWLIGGFIGLFIGAVAFGDSVLKALGWFRGGP